RALIGRGFADTRDLETGNGPELCLFFGRIPFGLLPLFVIVEGGDGRRATADSPLFRRNFAQRFGALPAFVGRNRRRFAVIASEGDGERDRGRARNPHWIRRKTKRVVSIPAAVVKLNPSHILILRRVKKRCVDASMGSLLEIAQIPEWRRPAVRVYYGAHLLIREGLSVVLKASDT